MIPISTEPPMSIPRATRPVPECAVVKFGREQTPQEGYARGAQATRPITIRSSIARSPRGFLHRRPGWVTGFMDASSPRTSRRSNWSARTVMRSRSMSLSSSSNYSFYKGVLASAASGRKKSLISTRDGGSVVRSNS